jgi:hypothetical protein
MAPAPPAVKTPPGPPQTGAHLVRAYVDPANPNCGPDVGYVDANHTGPRISYFVVLDVFGPASQDEWAVIKRAPDYNYVWAPPGKAIRGGIQFTIPSYLIKLGANSDTMLISGEKVIDTVTSLSFDLQYAAGDLAITMADCHTP